MGEGPAFVAVKLKLTIKIHFPWQDVGLDHKKLQKLFSSESVLADIWHLTLPLNCKSSAARSDHDPLEETLVKDATGGVYIFIHYDE